MTICFILKVWIFMLILNEVLDIAHVQECKQQFLSWISQEESIVIDCSAVSRVDAAGLQLLASLFITAQHNGQQIHFEQLSDVLAEGLALLGMTDLMQLKSE
ncbi:STAS domain-containing protein [Vibrio cholerae]|uniref:STAS domain-containing protein n=5 Tax=Vibrionaceae TaxID=641 RepID=A0AAW4H421_9VIBR|nr:STAS domain-containing protein [Vibrio paracholerae]MEB5518597.1 STAS domain-containing protein [Vibrio cholerae]MBN7281737.1 STAS domain-containing protein [Vibrio paracholerae]MBN7286683.1 STAS domain-containing protein [Vibrio paracholerae]MBP8549490.1 STAS domain-containing protein [Vibrio paracholerae]